MMNKLFLLALAGFALTISLALPFSEDEDETSNGLRLRDAERCDKKCLLVFISFVIYRSIRLPSVHYSSNGFFQSYEQNCCNFCATIQITLNIRISFGFKPGLKNNFVVFLFFSFFFLFKGLGMGCRR